MTYVNNPAIGKSHYKDNKLYRETSRKRYEEEKKEMEKELHENRTELEKILNEHYEYFDERMEHNYNMVRFKASGKDSFKELKFEFEENYMHLKEMWEKTE